MDKETLQINVKGWPPEHVQLVKKYAEEVGSAALGNGNLPNVSGDELRRLAEEGALSRAQGKLPEYLKSPPPGVLEELLHDREEGR